MAYQFKYFGGLKEREFDLMWFICSVKIKPLDHYALYDLHTILHII